MSQISEPCFCNPLLQVWSYAQLPANGVTSTSQQLQHFRDFVILRYSVVLRLASCVVISELCPSAGFEVVKNLLDESGPVFDGASHIPALDEVVRQWIGPGLLDIIDKKTDIWGDPISFQLALGSELWILKHVPARLNGAEIVPNYLLQSVKTPELMKMITSAEG